MNQNNIASQIECIDSSIEWIKKNKPADYEQRFLQLVEERRKLKMIQNADKENPAIAAYGVSQVGKSYLMNCLLQKDGHPFEIDEGEKKFKFIEEMNPKTDNTEATGVVTRFSSFLRNETKYSENYPILMKCLSVTDVVLVLCEGYYNDICDYTTYSEAEISEMGDFIYNKFSGMPVLSSSVITSDSVLDMRAYFTKHLNNAQSFLHTSFFDQLALVADRIPVDDYLDVFSVLWHESEYQTKLFRKLLSTLAKFQYAKYIYMSSQALLHNGINENTVMSVQCLNRLFMPETRYITDIYLKTDDGYSVVSNIPKSEICAVCAEIIVKIPKANLESANRISFSGISDVRVQKVLSEGREKVVHKNTITGEEDISYESKIGVLKDNDLLDFPGARSRKKEILDTLRSDAILINVLLRGKVAYLFNMYNESRLINVLLYCHHGAQNDVTDVPLLLNDWIMNYVGDTIEKRKKTIELTNNISPLFYIGTKFNMDMQEKPEQIGNSTNAINQRWHDRFEKVLYHQCFNVAGSLDSQNIKLFMNWTREGEYFKNSFVLRDFKFSGPLASKLYENENTDNKKMTIPDKHYQNLRETFCTNESVKRFFDFPELSWDVCASIDNDGSQYIIAQLAKVAVCMGTARSEQFKSISGASMRKVKDIMSGYFVSTDIDELLEGNIRKAMAIFREMDFSCNSDNYYFGHMIQALQLSTTTSYRMIHSIMQGPLINDKVNEFKDYEIIRNSCKNMGHPIEDADNDEDKWKCVIMTYHFSNQQDAEDFLSAKHVDPNKLFAGSFKRKLNSCIIADAIFDKWCSLIKSVDFMNDFSGDGGFDGSIMSSLVENLIMTANNLQMRDKMAESISEYVNVIDIHKTDETLLADILSSRINDFVLDFGYQYLSEDEITKAKSICTSKGIPAFKYICKELPATYSEEELTAMFNMMSTSPQLLLPSFDDNYNKWLEYMFVSFVAHLDIPDFDHEANHALSVILEQIKAA